MSLLGKSAVIDLFKNIVASDLEGGWGVGGRGGERLKPLETLSK